MNVSNEAALVVRRFALDTALWYCAPAIFMVIYIFEFSLPSHALGPHFTIVAMPFTGMILTRLAMARWLSSGTLHAWVCATLTTATLMAMVVYYCVVIGGLRSWGGIISWNVIPSYALQAPAYSEILGFTPLSAAAVTFVTFAAMANLMRMYLQRFDWIRLIAHRLSATTFSILLTSGCGIVAASIYKISADPWTGHSEPVSLTLFQDRSQGELQGHALDQLAASTLDRKEDAARATYAPVRGTARRNLILIVIDAQRPDHMGIYGYTRDTTPNLNRLARTRQVRKVEFVHSSCPDTACGLLSLSSSKFPRQFSFRPFTLQQVMRRNGYRVHMILGGDHTHFYSLRKFYGEVDTFYDGFQARSYFMNDDQLVLDRLAAMPSSDGAPTMFQFHLMSTHMLSRHKETEAYFKPAATYAKRFYDPDIGPTSRPDENATNYYDNGVLKSDRMVQLLLTILEEKGFLKNTLVVITADHGEGLGEHGLFVHMNSVREEVLRIPLVMIAYGYEPDRPLLPRAAPAQVDIAPTILAELGLPAPATWSGRALQEQGRSDFIYFEGHEDFGLIDRRDPAHVWKYWANAKTGAERAFDLSLDSHEARDVLAQVPQNRRLEWRVKVLPGTPLVF